ncbi:MAG: hypothetical protein V4691_00725 [Pseudomonadota bacterium]
MKVSDQTASFINGISKVEGFNIGEKPSGQSLSALALLKDCNSYQEDISGFQAIVDSLVDNNGNLQPMQSTKDLKLILGELHAYGIGANISFKAGMTLNDVTQALAEQSKKIMAKIVDPKVSYLEKKAILKSLAEAGAFRSIQTEWAVPGGEYDAYTKLKIAAEYGENEKFTKPLGIDAETLRKKADELGILENGYLVIKNDKKEKNESR